MITHQDDNLETFQLVWLDIGQKDSVSRRTTIGQELRTIINHVKVFNDIGECRRYIENATKNDRIAVIVGSQSSHEIILHLHNLRQVMSIYIYTSKGEKDVLTTSMHSQKVKAVSDNFDDLRLQLASDYQHRKRRRYLEVDEPISINIFNTNPILDQSSTLLNGQFMFLHLLLDVLLRIPSSDSDKDELIAVCQREYHGNLTRLTTLNEFKDSYTSEQALLWYTKESFLYNSLNKALRLHNVDLLFCFRFFINDIHQQLKQFRCLDSIRVYRGQVMSGDELGLLQNSVGQLISMNSFLSTSVSRDLALFFLGDLVASDGLRRVLFEIDADPQIDGATPFADITAQLLSR